MYIRRLLYLVIITSNLSCIRAQLAHYKTVSRLPKVLNESSGITANPDGSFWTHNDSGDKPQIYRIDSTGRLLQTVYLKGATAIDYEDITHDKQGNVYVCDCGNNSNQRQNLCIYKISSAEITSGKDSVTSQVIRYKYPDQTEFPPPKTKRNFDCEALVIFHDSVFLFSKNRGVSNYCKRYAMPVFPGTYVAALLDSVKTKRWVTSAAISPDDKTVVLLSENVLNIFTGFSGSSFFKGKQTKLFIPLTQKEGITFKTNTIIYLTDEVYKGFGGKLYSIKIPLPGQ